MRRPFSDPPKSTSCSSMAPSKLLDGLPEPRVYRPTMEEFRDFNSFVRKIEREDQAHLAGICKVVVPDEYIPRKAGYEPETFPFRIETPLKQVFDQIGDRGCYQTRCSPRSPMTISEYKEMATSTKYSPPKHDSYDELERKYWNSVHFVSPVYGADVTNAITDSDVEEWNSSKLNSVLKYVEEDSKQVYSVSIARSSSCISNRSTRNCSSSSFNRSGSTVDSVVTTVKMSLRL